MIPAVFLDRDGTLIADPGYISDPTHVTLLPGVTGALSRMARAGFLRVVITNQSGIARGKLSMADLAAVQAELARQLANDGAGLERWYYCPHLPDAGCDCRKPGVALHFQAARDLGIDLRQSWCVGDRMIDVEPARTLGARAVLVLTGEGPHHSAAATSAGIPVVADLTAAVDLILSATGTAANG